MKDFAYPELAHAHYHLDLANTPLRCECRGPPLKRLPHTAERGPWLVERLAIDRCKPEKWEQKQFKHSLMPQERLERNACFSNTA